MRVSFAACPASPPSRAAQVLFRLRIVALVVDGQDAFLHAGEHCLPFVLLAQHRLDPLVQLLGHAVHGLGQGADFLGTGDRSRWLRSPAAKRSAPALISSKGRLMRREITRLITAWSKDADQGRHDDLVANDAQRAGQGRDRQRGPHHGRRRAAVHQGNGHVDPLFLLGGTEALRLARMRRPARLEFPAASPWLSMSRGFSWESPITSPEGSTTVIRVLLDSPQLLAERVDCRSGLASCVKQVVDRFAGTAGRGPPGRVQVVPVELPHHVGTVQADRQQHDDRHPQVRDEQPPPQSFACASAIP